MEPQIYKEIVDIDKSQLENMLLYSNEDIISRFRDMYNVDEDEAQDLFKETRKFLFICQLKGIFIPDDLLILDEMWHNFILFTKEYHSFCGKHFGRYFHHLPASKKEKEEHKIKNEANPDATMTEYLQKMEHLMSTTYDYLGEETVIKWFTEYPVKYSKENVKKLRKE
ncbi:hypothetical protein [Flavobacterium piscis]|uniref:Uncharacterized protein n=1 Tax=Flavobacterium piscis TaxID=1114874 RepID=A0ABU1YB29_9FLAO|nr:hypothetical protein [Flavobacterium piscis]MDR7211437.1 hypothetical protein [Flavobacterium piscis]